MEVAVGNQDPGNEGAEPQDAAGPSTRQENQSFRRRFWSVAFVVLSVAASAVELLTAEWSTLRTLLITSLIAGLAVGVWWLMKRRRQIASLSFGWLAVLILLAVLLGAGGTSAIRWSLDGQTPSPPTIDAASPSSEVGPANSAPSTEEQAPSPPGSCAEAPVTDAEATVASSGEVPTQVRFTSPKRGAPRIDIASTVCVEGTVENLPAGHALWILSKPRDPDDSKTFFFVVGDGAVRTENGFWSSQAYSVGNESDKGKGFDYYAVDAGDTTCNTKLKVAAQGKENGVPVRRVRFDVESICTVLKPAAGVTFRK
jgi:hypothetical protein